jgi:hypothetical protein
MFKCLSCIFWICHFYVLAPVPVIFEPDSGKRTCFSACTRPFWTWFRNRPCIFGICSWTCFIAYPSPFWTCPWTSLVYVSVLTELVLFELFLWTCSVNVPVFTEPVPGPVSLPVPALYELVPEHVYCLFLSLLNLSLSFMNLSLNMVHCLSLSILSLSLPFMNLSLNMFYCLSLSFLSMSLSLWTCPWTCFTACPCPFWACPSLYKLLPHCKSLVLNFHLNVPYIEPYVH